MHVHICAHLLLHSETVVTCRHGRESLQQKAYYEYNSCPCVVTVSLSWSFYLFQLYMHPLVKMLRVR